MAAERLGELESSNKLVHRLNAAVQEAQQRAATDEQVRANPHFGGMQLLAEHARSSVSTVERLQREAQHASAFRTSEMQRFESMRAELHAEARDTRTRLTWASSRAPPSYGRPRPRARA